MVKGVKFLSLLLNASCSDVITVPLFFSLAPKPPLPLSSFDTHARWQTVTQSARSRWSYEKIEALNSLQFTVDPRQYALDKNLHSKSIYFLKLTHQERVMEVQWSLKRTHSRPQSPTFLGHVVLKPLPGVPIFRTSGHACAEVTNITAHAHSRFLSLTAPLGTKFYFLSSLQTMTSLGCFENADFTQLGFIDNLESKEDINKNQLNTLFGVQNWDN